MTGVFTPAITAGSPVAAPRDPQATGDGATFRALLERLQQFTKNDTTSAACATPAASDANTAADDLQQQLARADQSFTTAMDLRRQLEAAFDRHTR